MKANRHADGERTLAVFFDFENIGIGLNLRRDRFDIGKVVERLVEKGKLVVKKAYADWSRFAQYTAPLHEAAIELIEIPRRGQTGKNSADIRLCVDAMDLAYSKDHIDTFVIVSGDSDFSPLVSKLKELGRHVIGLGLAEATSDLLRDNCDEFIYYDDLDRSPVTVPGLPPQFPENKQKVFSLLLDSLLALRRENKEVLFSSMVKDTMKRKKPSFNEEYHGYRTFSELLEDAAKYGLIDIERHKGSGTYVVTRFGSEPKTPAAAPAPARSGRMSRPQADGRGAGQPSKRPPQRGERSAQPGRKPAPAAATVPEAPEDLLDLVEDRYVDE
ncbi:MAG TPA: NYN domain-containing protein [Gemmataceae bacterium]|nr:NYN domain-containing protein [Gemmataceae bacterium]